MVRSTPRRLFFVGVLAVGCSHRPEPPKAPVVPRSPTPVTAGVVPTPVTRQPAPDSGLFTSKPFPTITSGNLRNGMALDVIERRGLPIVTLTLMVQAGQAKDGNHAAVARTTAQLLEAGGAGRFRSEALRQAIDGLGTSLETVTTKDHSRWSLSVTSDKVSEALEILASLAVRPRFDLTEFKRLRERELERVRSLSKTSGAWLAQYWLHRELFSQPLGIHPYASIDVLPSELSRLTLAECVKFHQEQYVPANARLLAVGDVDLTTLHQRAESAFGTWSGKAPEDAGIGIPVAPDRLTLRIVDRPGSSQSDVLVGILGPTRKQADFPTLVALQQILGGGVAGRLFLDVREKRSLAYSTYTNTQESSTGPSVITLSAGTQTAKTAETVRALLENLERMATDPGSPEELEVAKNYIVRGMPARWETVESLSGQLVFLRAQSLPERHFDELRDTIAQLSEKALLDTAAKYYRKNNAVVVIAGDANTIAESLRAFGSVQVLDPEREFSIKRKLDSK